MVTVQEYLTTSYEADREYVDGELLERHSGERPHSSAHAAMGFLLFQQEAQAGVRVLMSQRVQVGPTRFRVPDVCVLLASDSRDPIVKNAPFLCVEILDRNDTVTRLNDKLFGLFSYRRPLRLGDRSADAAGLLLHAGRDARGRGWDVAHE